MEALLAKEASKYRPLGFSISMKLMDKFCKDFSFYELCVYALLPIVTDFIADRFTFGYEPLALGWNYWIESKEVNEVFSKRVKFYDSAKDAFIKAAARLLWIEKNLDKQYKEKLRKSVEKRLQTDRELYLQGDLEEEIYKELEKEAIEDYMAYFDFIKLRVVDNVEVYEVDEEAIKDALQMCEVLKSGNDIYTDIYDSFYNSRDMEKDRFEDFIMSLPRKSKVKIGLYNMSFDGNIKLSDGSVMKSFYLTEKDAKEVAVTIATVEIKSLDKYNKDGKCLEYIIEKY